MIKAKKIGLILEKDILIDSVLKKDGIEVKTLVLRKVEGGR